MKRYILRTLIDITETFARRSDDPTKYKQQQNWMTLIQTLGLRSNPIISHKLCESTGIANFGFGSKYKGKHRVWTVYFEFENSDDSDLTFLNLDFDIVPIASKLEETVTLESEIFQTKNEQVRNIVFSEDR